MFRPLVSMMLLMLSVAACGRDSPSSEPATASPDRSSTPPAQQAQPVAPAQTVESQQATEAQESVSDSTTTVEERGNSSLERLAAMPATQQLPDGRWKVGTHYRPFVPPQPTNVPAGKVEVVEVFWYGCSHCYSLEPFVSGWLKNKPEYAELVKLPVMWSPGHKAHARLYYTLEALGRHDLHQKVFETIHQEKNMLLGNSEVESLKVMTAFAKAQGLGEKAFMDAWNSFGVASSLQRATQLTQRYRVEGVPMVIVNGKYATDVSMAGGPSQLFALINDLAASEKRR